MANTYDTTGLPLGSTAVKVLYNNASNLDDAVNAFVHSWIDRFGRARLTLYGMEQDFDQMVANFAAQFNAFLNTQGLAYIGDYDTDGPLTVNALNQMFSKDDEFWTPLPSTPLPFVTTGNWNTDRPFFLARGDASVRQLLSESMAHLDASSNKLLIDLHYGICRGVGYNGTGGERVTTTTSAVASGYSLPVADVTGFVAGQLIVYLAGDGEYYTAVVDSFAGSTIILQTPIEVYIDNGASIGIFYTQESHATVLGYRAIADAAIRQATKRFETVYTWLPTDTHTLVGGASESNDATATYANAGSSTIPGLKITAANIGDGVVTADINLPAGDYVARVFVTPNMAGSSPLVVSVSEAGIGAISYSDVLKGGRPIMHEAYFRKSKRRRVSVSLLAQQVGQSFVVSKIEFVRLTGYAKNIDRGVHVLLGDSWFAQPGIAQRLIDRLPNATIINKGVGGDTATNLWQRFNDDVRPYDPDFVWVMCGTNDVANGVTPELFYTGMGIVSQYIGTTGATGIFFNCSVGTPTHPTLGDLLTPSRNYVLNEDLIAQGPQAKNATEVYGTPVLVTLAAGAKYRMLLPGFTKVGALITKLYVVGQAGETTGTVKAGFTTTTTTPLAEDVVSYAWAELIRTNLALNKSTTANRFLCFEFENTGGATVTLGGMVEVEWTKAV